MTNSKNTIMNVIMSLLNQQNSKNIFHIAASEKKMFSKTERLLNNNLSLPFKSNLKIVFQKYSIFLLCYKSSVLETISLDRTFIDVKKKKKVN